MAGIGFTLRRMLQEGGFSGPLKAMSYAMLISSGPWFASSATLALLGAFSALGQGSRSYEIFLAIVSYVFAFSLIATGAVHMLANRYLADRLYENRWETFAPAFAALISPLLIVQTLAAAVLLAFTPIGLAEKLAALVLYLAVTGTWLSMAFLSAAKDYRTIVWAFVGGFVISLAAGLWGAKHWALAGQLSGFAAGYFAVFALLVWRIEREFGLPTMAPEQMLAYFRRFWPLVVIGFCYNLGIWVDKIMFWFHPEAGHQVVGPFFGSPIYDNAMFVSYLTIVPAMGMFLLRVETDFYDTYRAYFAAIAARDRLSELVAAKGEMMRTLWENLGLVLKVQLPLTVGAVLFAPEVAGMLKLSWLAVFVFRFGAVGALCHVLHLMTLILLLYLDFRREAMWLALVFLGSNALLTLWAFGGGQAYWGLGYALSCAFTLATGVALLGSCFRRLEYHVFMRQPLT